MTAAEQKRQKIIAKREEVVERKKAALIRLHQEEQEKIAALDAKLDRVADNKSMTAAQLRVQKLQQRKLELDERKKAAQLEKENREKVSIENYMKLDAENCQITKKEMLERQRQKIKQFADKQKLMRQAALAQR